MQNHNFNQFYASDINYDQSTNIVDKDIIYAKIYTCLLIGCPGTNDYDYFRTINSLLNENII